MRPEDDIRFKHLSVVMDKFNRSGEGALFMEFLGQGCPNIVVTKGMDTAALTGAEVKGWRECMEYIKRLGTFNQPAPHLPGAEPLKSDKLPTQTPQ